MIGFRNLSVLLIFLQNGVEFSQGSPEVCLEVGFQNGHCYDTPETRWSFDPSSQICKSFLHSGCSPSSNIFCTQLDCVSACKQHYNPSVLNSTDYFQKSILKRQIADRFSLINRLCFKRYQIDPAKECHFNRVTAWYYNRLKKECRSYEACAPSHIIYGNKLDCEKKCRPLYEDIDPYSQVFHTNDYDHQVQSYVSMSTNEDDNLSELGKTIENLLERL